MFNLTKFKKKSGLTIKALKKLEVADHLPANVSSEDAMYELYVHMKISQGKKSANAGRISEHGEVKRKFLR